MRLNMSSGGGRTGSRCGRKAPGWFLYPTLHITDPKNRESIDLIRVEDTFPLIIVPIACGMVGIILVLYITAWIGGIRKWTRKLNIVCLPVISMTDLPDQFQLLHLLYTRHLGSLWCVATNSSDPEREPQGIQFQNIAK